MGIFITILVIGFVIYLIAKYSKKPTNTLTQQPLKKVELPIEIKITTSYSSGSSSSTKEEKFPAVKQNENGDWILNPGATFELTIMNADRKIVQQIRDLLDNDEIRDYRKDDKLVALFAEYNLKIKEIEEYKNKYKKVYFSKIEQLKSNSSEWNTLGEMDKEDLLIEFRKKTLSEIYERADCDLEILFEFEPNDITLDDELIKEYGFENFQAYLMYADNLDKIRIIPNDNYSRPRFEKLAEFGLAIRGSELSKEEILSTLTLKELNALANNPEKEYKRKNIAIEYILTIADLEQKIGKYISLRELFKLQPLPQKYSSLNLHDISITWKYYAQEAKLLMDTYRNAFYSWRDLKDKEDRKYVKGYTVSSCYTDDFCKCAKDREKKKYTKNNPPRVPCHIGCKCFLNKEYDFSS